MKMPVESGATLRQVINGAIKDGVTVDKAVVPLKVCAYSHKTVIAPPLKAISVDQAKFLRMQDFALV